VATGRFCKSAAYRFSLAIILSSASFNTDISLATFEAPIILPAAFFKGEIVCEICILFPPFVRATVS
jgi:hypothetical protein